jgi:hypothetical protein
MLIAILAALPASVAVAQTPQTITLRIDNDAFDFWMLPWNRPDEEYSSGVHITYDGGDAPWWSRRMLRQLVPCTTSNRDCRMGRAEIGQDLYTPATSKSNPFPAAGSRPNAGWLYLSQTARSLRRTFRRAHLTLGVTGGPSLVHADPRSQRRADVQSSERLDRTGYFRPASSSKYECGAARLDDRAIGFDVIPRMSVTAGNVSTNAEVGVQTRTGWHLRHPWLPRDGPLEISLTGGISARAVARDLFLDGNTFSDGPHVGHETFVGSGEIGVQMRFRALSLAYRAVNDTRSYPAGPKWHPWASIVGAVFFAH